MPFKAPKKSTDAAPPIMLGGKKSDLAHGALKRAIMLREFKPRGTDSRTIGCSPISQQSEHGARSTHQSEEALPQNQAAALRIHNGQDYPVLDLRADDHADPLAELCRLHSVAQERALHFAITFPTAENFSGTTDRCELDQFIAEREAQSTLDGTVSQSFATPLQPPSR